MLHFISGLPRSGSTLLAAILRQNPRFVAGMSSPLANLVMRMQEATSRKSESGVLISERQRRDILQGLFRSFYGDDLESKVVLDTSRSWCAKLPLIAELFPASKMICCVRDVGWIMDSVERLLRSQPLDLSGIFGFSSAGTVFSRVNGLASPDGLVGYAINALQEAYWSEFADRLILVDYEALARHPGPTMKVLYQFLGEDLFAHDFENVEYEAEDFDMSLGTPGLHRVKGPVAWRPRQTILPPSLFNRFSGDAFWRNNKANTRRVPVIVFVPPQEVPKRGVA
jgi:sulfotransferase